MQTYVHTYMRTNIHAAIPIYRYADIRSQRHTDITRSKMQKYRQTDKYINIQTNRQADEYN